MSFLSLLHSIRRSLKPRKEGSSATSSAERPRKVGGGARRGRGKRTRVLNSDDEDGGGGGGSGEREENKLDIKLVFTVLDKLVLVLGLVHLSRFPDSLKSLVQTMSDIPVLGFDFCGNSWNYNRLCEFCGSILRQALKVEHGEQDVTAAEVLKSLSPLILSAKSQARDFALVFVTNDMRNIAQDSSPVMKAMVNLPRYLSQKVPEKTDARSLAIESIMEIVKSIEFDDQVGFIGYVVKMAQGKSHLRYLAVDLIPKLMASLEDPVGSGLEHEMEHSWKLRCLTALIQRCSDSVAGIRARALSNLAQIVGSMSGDAQECVLLNKALGLKHWHDGGVNDLVRKRCTDEKAAVRKATLLLITKLMALVSGSLDDEILKTMGMACSDQLVSIRKTAIAALSEVRSLSVCCMMMVANSNF